MTVGVLTVLEETDGEHPFRGPSSLQFQPKSCHGFRPALVLCWRSVERSLNIFFPFISEAGSLSLRWNSLVSLQIFHPSPLRRANELGETCNRDSLSSIFYLVTATSLVRLALSAPAYYQVDFVFSASLAGELAPVCVVLPLLVVFPRLWGLLREPHSP